VITTLKIPPSKAFKNYYVVAKLITINLKNYLVTIPVSKSITN
jgi:hypothetical protein